MSLKRDIWTSVSRIFGSRPESGPTSVLPKHPALNVDLLERYQGCLLGLACGDAVGTSVEFQPRGSFAPVTDMVGGGAFHLPAGAWTDDTSMALCLAESLTSQGGFDAAHQMARYRQWWRTGYMSSTGSCFDIGRTTRGALQKFEATGDPMAGATDPQSAGNGSLMRLAPVALFYHPDSAAVVLRCAESSRTTHGAPEAVECCKFFGMLLSRALAGVPKHDLLSFPAAALGLTQSTVVELASGYFIKKTRDDLISSGYCVSSLEASLWCFFNTKTLEAAILCATNLGEDADTTAAITGQLAGAYYGVDAIPKQWLARLHMRPRIVYLANRLYDWAGTLSDAEMDGSGAPLPTATPWTTSARG